MSLLDWLGAAVFAAAGLGALGLALHLYLRTRAFLAGCRTAVGTVVGFEERDAGEGKHAFPLIAFRTSLGNEVQFVSGTSASPGLGKGERVRIAYPPATPAEAIVAEPWWLWGMEAILAFAGCVLLLFALGLLSRALGIPGSAAAMFGLAGLAMFAAGIVLYRRRTGFLHSARPAEGVVVRLDPEQSAATFASMTAGGPALVRFPSPHGGDIEFWAPVRPRGPAYREGERLTVLYDPATPGSARIERPRRTVLALLCAWGAALVAMSLYVSFK